MEREEKRRQLIKILAEIERRINQQNAKPKKRYISPAVREEVYAVYYDGLRRAIEDKGTENFPQAGGKKLYGELTMIVTVNYNGRWSKPKLSRARAAPRWTAMRRPLPGRPVRLAISARPCAARPSRSWWFRASNSPAMKRWKRRLRHTNESAGNVGCVAGPSIG
jgi:hypothetical protein